MAFDSPERFEMEARVGGPSARLKQIKMAQIRDVLIKSPEARQRAIAEFPLKVHRLAADLKEMCDWRDRGPDEISHEQEDMMHLMEAEIRECFRDTFGTELLESES